MNDAATAIDPANGTSVPATPEKFESTVVEDVIVAPLENDVLRVDLQARGGAVSQIWLKKFHRTAELRDAKKDDVDGWEPLFPPERAVPPALTIVEHGATAAEAEAMATRPWSVREEQAADGARVVVFGYRSGGGVEIEKKYTLRPGRYALDVELTSRKLDASLPGARIYMVRVASAIHDTRRGQMSNEPAAVTMVATEGEEPSVHIHHAGDLAEAMQTYEKPTSGRLAWGGVTNQYFVLLLAPADSDAINRTVAVKLGARDLRDNQSVVADLGVSLPLDLDRAGSTRLSLYAGPKDPREMERQGFPSFIPLVDEDHGSTFRWVNKALLSGLRLFYGWVGNWGVAIMLLTFVVRLLVFPITRAQQVSMAKYAAKMAVLKPKLDRLKEEMGADRQKFAQEQMKLLREHGATPPLFGCLSSFITLPVFVGMFQILRTAIELRQAPFVGWISDLSLADRLYTIPGIGIDINVLPILATCAFIVQIAIQPKPADPQAQQQQKIMMIMPIVFGVLFYGYAAGLSLYSLTSSALSIFETKVIRKKWPVPMPGQAIPAQLVKK